MTSTEDPETGADALREDLAELLRRRGLTEDGARADAVERRHGRGGRTARENLADLIDPGSLVEYGRFAIAAQRQRRDLDELIHQTPADGLIAGTARVNGDQFGPERSACAVLSYDYTGGRPGDTDLPVVSALHMRAFAMWARLSGVVPRIAIVRGRCFAGNAVIAGCSDLIVATEDISLGMGGPAMIAGGGLGDIDPDDVGPIAMQAENGVVDVVVADEAEAVAVTQTLLGYFQGSTDVWAAPDQLPLRELVPERSRRAYDVRPIVTVLADEGSVTFLRERFAPEMVTAFARIEGRPVGIIANNTVHKAGIITSNASDKAARFLQLCDAFGIGVLSLVDTPGFMVGPKDEATGLVRHASRLLVAGAALRVPFVAVVLRRAYGLGAQAMLGGSLHEPLLTVAWPSAHLGPMGLEGAVRLGMRKELAAITDDAEREQQVRDVTAALQENAKALNAAQLFELDDVIDPAETRAIIASTLIAATAHGQLTAPSHRFVDTW
jgi:acetyl-CoA carboxylase carboxyltransferase component